MNISLSAFAPENLVSRDGFGSPVPLYILYCLYVTIVMLQKLTKGSFAVDLENASIKIYHQDNGSLRVVKWFCLSKAVGSSVVLTLYPPPFCS